MNAAELVVAIVIIVTVGSVLKARYAAHRAAGHRVGPSAEPAAADEARRLREEVRALKERIQVLERVITDNESSLRLDREIEALREPKL